MNLRRLDSGLRVSLLCLDLCMYASVMESVGCWDSMEKKMKRKIKEKFDRKLDGFRRVDG